MDSPAAPKNEWLSVTKLATVMAMLVSAYSLGLTLLGYGYDLFYLDKFGLYPELLQRTPLDYLVRSYRPVLQITIDLTKYLGIEQMIDFVRQAFFNPTFRYLALGAGVFVSILVWFSIAWPGRHSTTVWKKAVQIFHSSIFVIVQSRLTDYLLLMRAKLTRLRVIGWIGWLVPPIGLGVGLCVLYCVLSFVFACTIFLLIVGPYIGSKQGSIDADAILNRKGCLEETARQGNCIRVIKDDCELVRGKLIDIGGNRIFLRPIDSAATDKSYIAVPLDRNSFESIKNDNSDRKLPTCGSRNLATGR
ncbi:hypothetical protein [Dechloromonas denitrificans]|uniref:hypothetical protein n=1 Tax=Dechloromonas denitrificans TaxID=281362 RepID=UPI001CF8D095|nr:hypothetical protein [Dechloromonas denitrificans]UCV03324.1 hypothetical protein KI611_20025 [Dechloromonas denitrificans]